MRAPPRGGASRRMAIPPNRTAAASANLRPAPHRGSSSRLLNRTATAFPPAGREPMTKAATAVRSGPSPIRKPLFGSAEVAEAGVAPGDGGLQSLLLADPVELDAFRHLGRFDLRVEVDVRHERVSESGDLPGPVDRALRQRDGHRVEDGDLPGQRQRFFLEPIPRDDPVDQADPEGLLGGDPVLAGEQELLGLPRPDQPRHHHRDHARAEPDLRLAEHRIVGGYGEVAHHHQVAPAGQAVAVDLGDDRFGVVEELEHVLDASRQLLTPAGPIGRAVLRVLRGLLLQVVAGAEGPAGATDHHHAGSFVRRCARQRFRERFDQGGGERVQHFRAVQREAADRADIVLQEHALAHSPPPSASRAPRLASWSAMITRWISDVPSQIRSTRTSRKNRSPTFSRMYPRPANTCTARSATRLAISDAYSFAIEQWTCWTFTSSPSSISCAVRYVISRAAHSSVSESASGKATPWCSMIGASNATLALANAVASSTNLSAAPQQRAAIISRSYRNHSYAYRIPSPSAPTRLVTGTRTSSNATIGWSSAYVWLYSGVRTTRTPGVSRSTMNIAWVPACSPSVSRAWKKAWSAWLNEVTCHFTPFRT